MSQPLSLPVALIICLAFASAFVGSLYVGMPDRPRDHPTTIKHRFKRIALVSFAVPMVLCVMTAANLLPAKTPISLLPWLGLQTKGLLWAVIGPLALTAVLFLGPLVMLYLTCDFSHFCQWLGDAVCDMSVWRDMVVGPISEEWVFRACMLPVLSAAVGSTKSVVISPIFFGVAHLHHLYELMFNQGLDLLEALPSIALQFCFTFVFGMYSAWLLVVTGHVAASIATHIFCNTMGFPDFAAVAKHPKSHILWTMYALGLVGFVILAKPLAASFGDNVYSQFP